MCSFVLKYAKANYRAFYDQNPSQMTASLHRTYRNISHFVIKNLQTKKYGSDKIKLICLQSGANITHLTSYSSSN